MKAINKLARILVSHNINGHEIYHILMTYFGPMRILLDKPGELHFSILNHKSKRDPGPIARGVTASFPKITGQRKPS